MVSSRSNITAAFNKIHENNIGIIIVSDVADVVKDFSRGVIYGNKFYNIFNQAIVEQTNTAGAVEKIEAAFQT